jgi:hypothetical protein
MYRWLVYLHVLGGLGFMLSHGVSALMAFQVRREREIPRLRALLDVSAGSGAAFFASFLLLLISGIASGFIGRWWSQGWIWISLVLLIAISVYMTVDSRAYYHELRRVVGLPYMAGSKQMAAQPPSSAQQIEAVLASHRPVRLALIGLGGTALILWLMMFKPF